MGQDGLKKEHSVLHHLSHIAPQIVHLRDQENLTEFVLHELCCPECFNLEKAAYFVDNPDFDCLKGVAGFSRLEAYPNSCSIWESPKSFSLHMRKAPFNQKVRSMYTPSMKKSHVDDAVIAQEIAHNLGFENYNFYSWDMKYDNHGILLFERSEKEDVSEQHLQNGIRLLSFCPVF